MQVVALVYIEEDVGKGRAKFSGCSVNFPTLVHGLHGTVDPTLQNVAAGGIAQYLNG